MEILITALALVLATWFFTRKYYTRDEYLSNNVIQERCFHCAKYFMTNSQDYRIDNLCYECKSGSKTYVR